MLGGDCSSNMQARCSSLQSVVFLLQTWSEKGKRAGMSCFYQYDPAWHTTGGPMRIAWVVSLRSCHAWGRFGMWTIECGFVRAAAFQDPEQSPSLCSHWCSNIDLSTEARVAYMVV